MKLFLIFSMLIIHSCNSQGILVKKLNGNLIESENKIDSSRLEVLKKLRIKLFENLKQNNVQDFILIENFGVVSFSYSGVFYSTSNIYLFDIDKNFKVKLIETSKENVLNDTTSVDSCILAEIMQSNLSRLLVENSNVSLHTSIYLSISKNENIKSYSIKNICLIDESGNINYQ